MDETTRLLEEIKAELVRKAATYESPKRYPLARRTLHGTLASGSLLHYLVLEHHYEEEWMPLIGKHYGEDSKLFRDGQKELELVRAFADTFSAAK